MGCLMNASSTYTEEQELEYKTEFGVGRRPIQSSEARRPNYRRRKNAQPKQFNGIHRRRRKAAR